MLPYKEIFNSPCWDDARAAFTLLIEISKFIVNQSQSVMIV